MWRAKFIKTLPRIASEHPKAQFIFLTLTVKNCELVELRANLDMMNHAWKKMTERACFPAMGWVRAVEVTRAEDDRAHPHFHCLLLVPMTYFSSGYLSQEKWGKLWQSCLGTDYTPRIDVRAIRPKRGRDNGEPTSREAMVDAALYTLKYTAKVSDIIGRSERPDGMTSQAWMVELATQLHRSRAIATGGVLKKYLKVLEDERVDLVHADESDMNQTDINTDMLTFGWRESAKRYQSTAS